MTDAAAATVPNPFAQFDSLRSNPVPVYDENGTSRPVVVIGPDPVKAGENPFAAFDHLRSDASKPDAAPSPTIGSIVKQVPTGFNESVADIAGAPVDAMTWLLNKVPGIDIKQPVGGSDSIKRGMAAFGVPNPDDAPANGTAERIARGVGSGVAGMLAPEMAGAALSKTIPAAADVIGNVVGRSASLGDLASSTAVGASAGGSGQGAAELAPDQFKPLASTLGGLAGGLGAALATQIPGAAIEAARSAKDYAAPLTKEGQERTAGGVLASKASSPQDVIDTIGTTNPELIPGSQPTTFQLTGDMGLGSLERDVQTKNPVPFLERRADQNTARVDALQGVQTTGKPEDLSNFLRTRLADIDQASNDAIEGATRNAQTATAGIGGHQSPEFYGAAIQNEVGPRQAALTQDAQTAVRRMGGEGSPEGYGTNLRTALQAAEDAARGHERQLWGAVDPDNSLTADMTPFKTAANRIYGNLPRASELGVDPAERQLLQVINGYGRVEPFRELTGLRSEVSSALRQELRANGRTPAYARLSQLRGAIEDGISSAVEQRAGQEAEAVGRGELSPDATIGSRLEREARDYSAASRAAARRQPEAYSAANGPSRAPNVSPTSGTEVQSDGRSANAARDQGIQDQTPNFDAAARERLNAASVATRERAQAFGQGPIGQTLKTLGTRGNYRMPDAAVPANIFKAGPTGFESVNAFRQAVGNDRAALDSLRNYAASSLRREAERPDGTLDPNRFNMWRRKYQDALRAVPEVQQTFANAAQASEALHNFTPFHPDLAPSTIPEQFFHSGPSGFEGINQLRSLIGDRTATTILSDYAASEVRKAAMRPDGVLDPAKFTRWQKSHADALRAMPGLADRFATAAQATDAIDAAATARREALANYQTGAVGKLLGHTEGADITREVGSIFGRRDAALTMHRLADEAKANPGALDGLRRSVADFMYNRFISNTEAATSDRNLMKPDMFQSFVRDNEGSLKALFSTEEFNVFRAIAGDLRRSNRSLNAVKIPGQSNTAQDTVKLLADKGSHGVSLLAKLSAGVGGGYAVHGVPGAVAGGLSVLGQSVVSTAREAGLSKVDDLVREALLDPGLARSLLLKAPERPNSGSAVTLAQQLRRLSMFEASNVKRN